MRIHLILLAAILAVPALAVSKFDFVRTVYAPGDFKLVGADIYVAPSDWECNRMGAEDLAHDLELVTGVRPRIRNTVAGLSAHAILIGTLGRGEVIDRLDREKKIAADRIRGKWEGSLVQVVDKPLAGVEKALVLAGSDRRGAKYAIYEVSDNIGVSPYFKLNNVLPPRRAAIYVKGDTIASESSFVKYRGHFADDNRASAGVFMTPDENGRLYGGWASKRGGWTTENYVAFGEWDGLIRSKSNTYFPCEGLYTNIPFNNLPDANEVLINQYGLVRSGGHLLSMLTTWVNEFPLWLKSKGHNPTEPFYYKANHDRVVEFWKYSIEKNKGYEVLWPLGLRGDGDRDYSEPGVEDVPALVRKATAEQARLIAETPGLAGRDMVITGWRSDYGVVNLGQVPKGTTYASSDGALDGAMWFDVVPLVTEEQRRKNPGAKWGAYFHDSVRMGTIRRVARDQSPGLAKINHQFNMLLDHGMDSVWEVNNGPYKHMQYAMEYIAAIGRDPEYWRDPRRVDEFVYRVMRRDFGETHARAIARIFRHMDTRNLMNFGTLRRAKYGIGVADPRFYPDPYSIVHFGDEYAKALEQFDRDLAEAYAIREKLEPQQRDGFWQTIIWPLKLHIYGMKQHYYGYKANLAWNEGRRSARVFLAEMDKAAQGVIGNALDYQTVNGGFWYGYTQDDPREWPRGEEIWGYNSNDAGKWYHEYASTTGRYSLTEPFHKLQQMIEVMEFAGRPVLDVTVEGEVDSNASGLPVFSVFNKEKRFFDIGNKGNPPFAWTAKSSRPWIRVSPASGTVEAADARVWVTIDWARVPVAERDLGETITISAGQAGSRTLNLRINNPKSPRPETVEGHVEVDGYLAIEAEHYTRNVERSGAAWRKTRISFRDGGESMCAWPMNKFVPAPAGAPELVYRMHFQNTGRYYLNFVIFDRTLYRNFWYSMDGGRPALVDGNYPKTERDEHVRNLPVEIAKPGVHELHVYMNEPGVTLDQIVFTREPADIGNFRIVNPVTDAGVRLRGAVAPESYRRPARAAK